LSDAESTVRRYLDANGDSADAHYLLAYVLFKEQKPKESIEEYMAGGRYRAPGALELKVIGCDYFLMEDYGTADKWLTKSMAQRLPRLWKAAICRRWLGIPGARTRRALCWHCVSDVHTAEPAWLFMTGLNKWRGGGPQLLISSPCSGKSFSRSRAKYRRL